MSKEIAKLKEFLGTQYVVAQLNTNIREEARNTPYAPYEQEGHYASATFIKIDGELHVVSTVADLNERCNHAYITLPNFSKRVHINHIKCFPDQCISIAKLDLDSLSASDCEDFLSKIKVPEILPTEHVGKYQTPFSPIRDGDTIYSVGFTSVDEGGSAYGIHAGSCNRHAYIDLTKESNSSLIIDTMVESIQTDIPFNTGFEGSPLLVKQTDKDNTFAITGIAVAQYLGVQNMGLAISVKQLNHAIRQYKEGISKTPYPEGWARFQSLKQKSLIDSLNLPEDFSGMRLVGLHKDSDASKYLKKEDLVTHVDGFKVIPGNKINVNGRHVPWVTYIQDKYIGDFVNVKVLRPTKPLSSDTTYTKHSFNIQLTREQSELQIFKRDLNKPIDFLFVHGLMLIKGSRGLVHGGHTVSDTINKQILLNGKPVYRLPTNHPDDSLWYIGQVLPTKETDSLDGYIYEPIHEINGKVVRSDTDILYALKQPHTRLINGKEIKYHAIKTDNHDQMAYLPVLSQAEQADLLHENKIIAQMSDRIAALKAEVDADTKPHLFPEHRILSIEPQQAAAALSKTSPAESPSSAIELIKRKTEELLKLAQQGGDTVMSMVSGLTGELSKLVGTPPSGAVEHFSFASSKTGESLASPSSRSAFEHSDPEAEHRKVRTKKRTVVIESDSESDASSVSLDDREQAAPRRPFTRSQAR